jgi:hypothetical protein
MIRRKVLSLFAVTCMVLFLNGRASAQAVNNAQIHGVVHDPTGAIIPKAIVKATNIDTGIYQSTVSGSDGTFTLADLSVGRYTLDVTAPGFSMYVQNGIRLQVGQNVQVNGIRSTNPMVDESGGGCRIGYFASLAA